jgi:hypothetical protein
MNMRNFVKVILLAEAFAVTTFGLGWWSVPLVAALWGLVSREDRRARTAALCAAGGWATLLLLDFARGPVATMGTQLGGVMNLPPAVLYLVTLIFPALLAWAAAALMPRLRGTSS